MADEPIDKDDKGRFITGNIGGGRPKGARNKLGEDFILALAESFEQHGQSTIDKVRIEKPDVYVKVIASLLPKEFKIETTSDMTDEQLDARLRQLADYIAQAGTDRPAGGEEAQIRPATAH